VDKRLTGVEATVRIFTGTVLPAIIVLFVSSGSNYAEPLSAEQRQGFEQAAQELTTALAPHERSAAKHETDAAIFAKGLVWALRYDREFTAADLKLLDSAVRRGKERTAALEKSEHSWTTRRGKIALGYRSQIDDSVQLYGLIVPKTYDPRTPIRLDVVLHGSTRPVGMSELRFVARFDEGDNSNAAPPDQPYIELHPLGRVENCYRWAGETDVFEAIEDVCRRYNIDRQRIVLRGMSMGASGTWHLGLKYPDRFAALGPYCGYVDTHRFSETPLPNFVRVGPLPEHQELGLHMLDSVDYAANAGIVPVVACMGEKDVFFQAHVIMGEAMQREGLSLMNLISPGTGHVIDPKTHAEQMRRIAELIAEPRRPKELRFVTWTLKYNRCHWLEVLQLEKHYVRAELSARLKDRTLLIDEPHNITRFAIHLADLPTPTDKLNIDETSFSIPAGAKRIVFAKADGKWTIAPGGETLRPGKRPGLQGPIDDAFNRPFLCVRGTGKPWNKPVQEYAEASLRRFAEEWRHYFRGELPVKDDVDVTAADVASRHLILFGDPGSNPWIAKVLPSLPMKWTQDSLQIGGLDVSAAEHVPALIAPNPLPNAGEHYVVLNSGHTFREAELNKLNYLLFPRWGDWACLKLDSSRPPGDAWEDNVVRAGFFDENWRLPKNP
jgi:hypothetical protein